MARPAHTTPESRAEAEAANLPDPDVRTTRLEVSCLPEGEAGIPFTVTVDHRGNNLWIVTRPGRCLAKDGTWSVVTRPPEEHEGEWAAAHLFHGKEAAVEAAKRAAKLMTVRGRTVTDALRDPGTT